MLENTAFSVIREHPLKEFPVTLEDAKSFLGINNDREDDLIKNLISISTEYAQWFMEKSLTKQTLLLRFSGEVIKR
ncbi:MAG: phage head-tail connector protein [Aaplasma endosymbiont of Hyalomma asiaticum]